MMSGERALIAEIQAGTPAAFAVLYERYVEQIYTFIYYKTHHRQTAEDLTSMAFIKALAGIGSLRAADDSFRPWIYTIARNTVIDHYRTHRQHADIADVWDLAGDDDIARDAELKRQLSGVQEYLKDLDPVHRDVILLRVWQEMSYAEIAPIVGKSPEHCKVIFSRAIRKLRADLAVLLAMAVIRLYMGT
jgi:RNA polymerase sigma-70 factor (ECF subfamily)